MVSKPEFDFIDSPIFQNISIAAWDSGKYNATLSDWWIWFSLRWKDLFFKWMFLKKYIHIIIFIGFYFGNRFECRLSKPDFQLFRNYKRAMKKRPNAKLFLVDPRSIWSLWRTLHIFTGTKIRKNPPSSGFIGESWMMRRKTYGFVVQCRRESQNNWRRGKKESATLSFNIKMTDSRASHVLLIYFSFLIHKYNRF